MCTHPHHRSQKGDDSKSVEAPLVRSFSDVMRELADDADADELLPGALGPDLEPSALNPALAQTLTQRYRL
ncbi:hypothetical protein DAEQUDRAFT_771006 [Daedalea quercina L-15889]|uniref:Uncharacterized protein n=1 Tax=Daedalea quercina L-15889 TaxID=1314783 RepID=A0A165KEP8_9APHY|nr:hypothetical protein DAEQUDRAFT_771006 [Daedalea quercina L-15889]